MFLYNDSTLDVLFEALHNGLVQRFQILQRERGGRQSANCYIPLPAACGGTYSDASAVSESKMPEGRVVRSFVCRELADEAVGRERQQRDGGGGVITYLSAMISRQWMPTRGKVERERANHETDHLPVQRFRA